MRSVFLSKDGSSHLGAYATLGAIVVGAGLMVLDMGRERELAEVAAVSAPISAPPPAAHATVPAPMPVVAPEPPPPPVEKMVARVTPTEVADAAPLPPAKPKHRPHKHKPLDSER